MINYESFVIYTHDLVHKVVHAGCTIIVLYCTTCIKSQYYINAKWACALNQ